MPPALSPATDRFELAAPGPFRLDFTAWALRRQAHNRIDRWDGACYGRTLACASGAIDARVRAITTGDETDRLDVELEGPGADAPAAREETAHQLRRLLGLDAALEPFHARAASDPELGPLARRFRGMRPPHFPDLFETLANAIACQQVSLHVGILVLGRLAERFGAAGNDGHAFPPAEQLLEHATPTNLRELGLSFGKAGTLLGVAEACASGELCERELAALSDRDAIARLTALHGIGRWSAEYTLLRGLGRLHVFPGDDIGARRQLARWLGLSSRPDHAGTRAALDCWRRDAGTIYLHLLLQRLHDNR